MSYPRYSAYKLSGFEWLGEVPEHWEVTRLRRIAQINPARSEIAELEPTTEVSFVPMEAVVEGGGLILDRTVTIEESQSGLTYFRDNDVVVAKITPCFENGKLALAAGLTNGIALGTTELHVIRSGPYLFPEFLLYLVASNSFRMLGESEMYGAGGQKRVPADFVLNFGFALPPLDEQRAIAAFLDRETAQIDTLIAKLERLIALLQEKRQALISHAVTKGLDPTVPMKDSGVEWLGQVPAHWEVAKLGMLLSRVGSGKTPLGGAERYVEEGVLFLRSQNVYDEGLYLNEVVYIPEEVDNDMAHTRVQNGDILLNITGASLGRTCIVPDGFPPANVNQHVSILRLSEEVMRGYVSTWLKSASAKDQMNDSQTGAAREGLSSESIKAMRISFPPTLAEANEVVSFVESNAQEVDAVIQRTEQSCALLSDRRVALITAAVTGSIDVRDFS